MIDPDKETLITMKEARCVFPNRPSLPTVWRWILRGSKGIRLDSMRIGGRRYTSKEAIDRFLEATAKADRLTATPKRQAKDKRKQSLNTAKLILDQFGV